jgi:hypothetical protein
LEGEGSIKLRIVSGRENEKKWGRGYGRKGYEKIKR